MRRFIYTFKRYKRRIKNLIRWLPIIWKDEQWDYVYVYRILKFKLMIMAESIRKYDNHTLAAYDADKIMLCAKLIDKLQKEEYIEEYYNTVPTITSNETTEGMLKAQEQHMKAKRILFKALENYIERWWY